MSKATLFFLLVTCASAQPAGLLNFNWDKLAAKAVEKTDINLDGPTLRMATRFFTGEKGDTEGDKIKSLIQQLQGVYVKSFTFDKEGQYSEADVNQLRSQLNLPGWSKILDSQSKSENSAIYMKTDGKQAQGMVIIDAEPKEFTVVQILGSIDPEALNELGGKMGIPRMQMGPRIKTETKKDD